MYMYIFQNAVVRQTVAPHRCVSLRNHFGSTRATSQANPRFVDFVGRRSFQVPGPRPACLTSLQL